MSVLIEEATEDIGLAAITRAAMLRKCKRLHTTHNRLRSDIERSIRLECERLEMQLASFRGWLARREAEKR